MSPNGELEHGSALSAHRAQPAPGRPRRAHGADRACGEQLARTCVLSVEQRKVLRALGRCRTAELGGHLDICERCG